ncbi:MAG: hypothetical protein IJZ47_12980 [Oscillospiraceae bacterium]|nr:hypothetical protein [Oscillospiraceae bacterium]MBQ8196262.1 hypothetical protein [Oscillospiraceae bacterium]
MKVQNIVLAVASIGGAILTAALIRNGVSSKTVKAVPKVAPEPEKYFKGVPLSKLTELAKQIYHGIYCSIDEWGFLIFHHKSNRGHQTFHTQMALDEAGKLINLGGHYPGQSWSGADEFAKKANEVFKFKQ